ncbi:unnamed protein product [Boreogadus saida]
MALVGAAGEGPRGPQSGDPRPQPAGPSRRVCFSEKTAVQKQTYTRWMNVFLKRCAPPLQVEDLLVDLGDGRALLALLEQLSGCQLVYRIRPSSHCVFRLNNIAKALAFLDDRHNHRTNRIHSVLFNESGSPTLCLFPGHRWPESQQVAAVTRGDQGDGGGTLGAYGRMYPPLPLCGPDGEYIFPGGLQESRHSVLSDINSVIGEYLVICSTPHVPQKGNPSAPPDYANHDAIQIPQQCQHPNHPTQQPPAERSGGVTKDESLNGGFDDNIQPHCSAMGGAATPHMKTTDEEDKIGNLRPLKKIESAEGRTIVYEPSNPKDIERWSAEIDHPRRAGLQPWMQLKQLMHLYELHPNDGLAILFKHLSSTERTQIRYEVEEAIGEDGMRPEKGWDNNTDLDSLDLALKLIDTG